ncbi:1-acyl-sn-glycerol-3-phosphate acyltransferase 2-like protein [Tanacetum coccineum]
MLRLFKGKSDVINVKVTRHLMKDLPESDEAVAQWCKDIFVVKDAVLDKHKELNGTLLLSPQQVVNGENQDTTIIFSPNTMVDLVLEIVQLSKIH